MCRFLSYVSANYYLNSFTVGKVFTQKNKKGELFIQTQSTSNTLADDFTRKTVVVKSHLS